MKKLLLFVCIPFCFFSCTATIDKKIVLTEYQETIKAIKKENTEYSEDDFVRASKIFDKIVFKSLLNDNKNIDKTYKLLLDEAKTENEKDSALIKEYYDKINDMKNIVSLSVVKAQYFNEYSPVLKDNYKTFIAEINLTNATQKNITGIKGALLVKNKGGEIIKKCYIELADSDLLPIGKTQRDAREYSIVEGYDNIFELEANAPDKYEYDWDPENIIFADGSKIVKPDMPVALLLEN